MDWLLSLFQNVVFQTVISGVFVFIISEVAQKFLLDPLHQFKGVIGKIDSQLIFYRRIFGTPIPNEEINKNCREIMRRIMSDLGATYNQIPFNKFLSVFIRKIPKRRQIQESIRGLRFLANNVGQGDGEKNIKEIEKIRENLNIREL